MPWPQVITPYLASSVTQICCIFCALLFMLIYYAFKSSWVDHKVFLVTRVQALFFAMMTKFSSARRAMENFVHSFRISVRLRVRVNVTSLL